MTEDEDEREKETFRISQSIMHSRPYVPFLLLIEEGTIYDLDFASPILSML